MTNITSFIDWHDFINLFLKSYNSSKVLKNEDTVLVSGYEYFKNLGEFLKEYRKIDEKMFLANFKIFSHLLKFSLLESEYNLSNNENADNWKDCIDLMNSPLKFGFIVSRMFVKKTIDNLKVKSISEIKEYVVSSFVDQLSNMPWIDKETIEFFEQKLKNMTELIGFPNFIMNDTEINNLYSLDKTLYNI